MDGVYPDIIHPFVVKTPQRLIGNTADNPRPRYVLDAK